MVTKIKDNHFLLSVDHEELYTIESSQWIYYIEKAQSEGWKPDGTLYDEDYKFEERSISEDVEENLFIYIKVHDEHLHWDGNYIEKSNQLIDSVDAYYLAVALEGIADKDFLDFLQRGSLRICE